MKNNSNRRSQQYDDVYIEERRGRDNIDDHIVTEILQASHHIFDRPITRERFLYVLEHQRDVSVIVVRDTLTSAIIGFKIGYQTRPEEYYSWLGGIHPNYRSQGYARLLMEYQHNILKENNYKFVATKTQNTNIGMLLLNLRYGFEIYALEYEHDGTLSVLLRKKI